MTDEIRADIERVWEELAMIGTLTWKYRPIVAPTIRELQERRIRILFATREKWIKEGRKQGRNEALERALNCPYCGAIAWTVREYGLALHKTSCPYSQGNLPARALKEE